MPYVFLLGVTQPHSVLEHLVPMREVDVPSLSSSSSNLKVMSLELQF